MGIAKEAILALTSLVMASPSNVARLLEMDAACQSIFVECLPACGDFGIQVHTSCPKPAAVLLLGNQERSACMFSNPM